MKVLKKREKNLFAAAALVSQRVFLFLSLFSIGRVKIESLKRIHLLLLQQLVGFFSFFFFFLGQNVVNKVYILGYLIV